MAQMRSNLQLPSRNFDLQQAAEFSGQGSDGLMCQQDLELRGAPPSPPLAVNSRPFQVQNKIDGSSSENEFSFSESFLHPKYWHNVGWWSFFFFLGENELIFTAKKTIETQQIV